MIDLNTKCKTIKLLDCNIGALTSVVGKDFLNKTQIALTIMKKMIYCSTLKLETAVLQSTTRMIEEKALYVTCKK